MTLTEHLWAGWRTAYIEDIMEKKSRHEESESCVFCGLLASGAPDKVVYIVRRGVHTMMLLNAYPYTSGHLLVMPYRHVGMLHDLTSEESAELWEFMTLAEAAVRSEYQCEGINLGFNLGQSAGAGVLGHIHGHVLPRWAGDSNFMGAVANARVLSEPLDVTWSRISTRLSRLS